MAFWPLELAANLGHMLHGADIVDRLRLGSKTVREHELSFFLSHRQTYHRK